MIKGKTVVVVGGDSRQRAVAKLFSENNTVYTMGIEVSGVQQTSIENLALDGVRCDYIVLPMPITIDNVYVYCPLSREQIKLDDVVALAHNTTSIYGGKINRYTEQVIEKQQLWYMDYLDREDLSILNAIPTAEGAVQIAMEELQTTIYDTKCLIVGYGRIGKVLARYMSCLGADVTVSARKSEDIAWIKANGYRAVQTKEISQEVDGVDIIFNTVPHMVITQEIMELMNVETRVVDLASKPGGVDFEYANKKGIKTIWALALPGKVAPYSAGKIIFDTITQVENERGEYNE